MAKTALLQFREEGIYCPVANVYIDPWKPVERALITHGHSDHARYGHRHYLCTKSAAPVMYHRLGKEIKLQTVAYGAVTKINGVEISYHPAGHVVGSAQIKLSYKGETWVVSGDYKVEDDGISEAFEPVPCQHFITECTFGLPVYQWKPQSEVIEEIHQWWTTNQLLGKTSILSCYALGKAQRILANIDPSIGPVFTHGSITDTTEVIRQQGFSLPDTREVNGQLTKQDYKGALILSPGSSLTPQWLRAFGEVSTAAASGWMLVRGARRRRSVDRGFVLSDHADWAGLNKAIRATGATHVYPTHGYTHLFAKWLQSQGYEATPVTTDFGGDENEVPT